MEYNVDDSDRSSSPPPTPTDKPLRSKRSHRKTTPPQGSQSGSNLAQRNASPHGLQALQPMQMSSAQSTPDPGRSNPFFTPGPTSATSPNAVNGNSQHTLPPLSHLPPLQPSHSRLSAAREGFYDAAYDEQRTAENDAEYTGRRRTHSGTQPPGETANGDRRSVDVEMTDAGAAASVGGFTAVNR
jgi:hypothetical protein